MHYATLPSLLLSAYGRDSISYWDPHVHRIFCTHSVLFGSLHQGIGFDGLDINVLYSGLRYSRGLLSVARRCFLIALLTYIYTAACLEPKHVRRHAAGHSQCQS